MRPHVVRLLLVLFVASFGAATAEASPHVRVRGRSELQLVLSSGTGSLIAGGRLVDDIGDGIPNQSLAVSVVDTAGTRARTLLTGFDGSFEWSMPRSDHLVLLRATFGGDPNYDPAHREVTRDGPSDATQVSITPPPGGRIDLDSATIDLALDVEPGEAGAGRAFEIHDELGHTIVSAVLDEHARWRAALPASMFGEPGPGRLSTYLSGKPADNSPGVDVMRFRTSSVTLDAAPDDSITLRGTVRLRDQTGLPEQPVTILVDGARVATALTDAKGKFEVHPAPTWPRNRLLHVVATHESGLPWLVGGRSLPLRLEVLGPASSAWWIPLLAGALATLAFVGTLRLPLLRRSLLSVPTSSGDSSLGVDLAQASGGREHAVLGAVVDSRTLQVIPDAEIVAESHEATLRAATTENGQFHLLCAQNGKYAFRIRAPGYVDGAFQVTIPHRGEWRGARFKLLSHRHAARDEFDRGMHAVLGRSERHQVLTAREALSQLSSDGATVQALARALTADFETAYYAEELPTQELVEALREQADGLDRAIRTEHAESFDAPRGGSL